MLYDLCARADEALYLSMNNGRGRLTFENGETRKDERSLPE